MAKAMSLGDIIKASYRYRPRRDRNKNARPITLDNVEFSKDSVPYLIVEMSLKGTDVWKQRLHLHDPQFAEQRTGSWIPVVLRGVDLYMRPFDAKTPTRVRCSCPDFRHRFSHPDAAVKSLVGKKLPYTKKTDREPLNPDNIPGMCKHLHEALMFLAQPKVRVIDPRVVTLG